MITVKRKVKLNRDAVGRRRSGDAPVTTRVEAGRIPRISRLMAVAIRMDRMLRTGGPAPVEAAVPLGLRIGAEGEVPQPLARPEVPRHPVAGGRERLGFRALEPVRELLVGGLLGPGLRHAAGGLNGEDVALQAPGAGLPEVRGSRGAPSGHHFRTKV